MTDRQLRARPAASLAAGLGILLALAGCPYLPFGPEGDGRFDDLEAVPPWFERHRSELEVIMRLLLPHESIRRVWSAEPSDSRQYGKLSLEDGAAYAGAIAIKERLGIVAVIVWRPDGRNPAFSFILWRIGMVGSGRDTSVEYDENMENYFHRYYTPPNKALDLGVPNWFAFRSSSD